MTDQTNDIDALLDLLAAQSRFGFHSALTALVAERNALRDELERERMRLAACGVAAMANTRETAANARACAPEYRSASFDDVCRIVDSEMSLRDRVAELEAQQPASDLRERLVCAIWPEILRQWREYTGAIDPQYTNAIDPRGNARADALQEADKMIAAMRKGETDGK